MKTNELTVPNSFTRQLLSVSTPLMICSLALLFMIFVDRIFLANYSVEALNAAVSSGTLAWAFFGGMGMFTVMSQVFVAQYNGAQKIEKIGSCVWQMIWISIFSIAFFLPLAFWASSFFYKNLPDQISYFSILMAFAPGYALMMALSGFYIGREKTKLLIALAIGSNLINIILDYALIFGVKGLVPEMGIKGAAIATCVGYILQAVVLMILFLLPKNRALYKTHHWKIDKDLFLKEIKVGSPQGIFYGLEIMGWAIFFEMMSTISLVHITISSICQSLIILLSFFMDGLGRGVTAISGNYIGAKRHDLIQKIFRSGVRLQVYFSTIILLFFILDPTVTLSFFFSESASHLLVQDGFITTLRTCLIFVFFYLTFEGVRWVIAGLLSAAGDTLFLLISGVLSVWVFLLAPIYLIVVRYNQPIESAWAIALGYSALTCLIYYVRYNKGKWKKINLIDL